MTIAIVGIIAFLFGGIVGYGAGFSHGWDEGEEEFMVEQKMF